jgi:hypothetical protein
LDEPSDIPAPPGNRPKSGKATKTSFKKGQSGNPAGRPKDGPEAKEAKSLALKKCPRAIERLGELMEHDEPYAVTAANALLDRGLGKPTQEIEHGLTAEAATLIVHRRGE